MTDLKTGRSELKLTPGEMEGSGRGFQVLLYGLIVAEETRSSPDQVMLRVFQPRILGGDKAFETDLKKVGPQAAPLLAFLNAAWIEGVFGQRSDGVGGKHGPKPARPIAYLRIPNEVLRAKWNKTPSLSVWEWRR